jgi:hypothetical protein
MKRNKSVVKPKGTKAQELVTKVNQQKLQGTNLSGVDAFKMKKFAAVPGKVQTHRITSARETAEPQQEQPLN